MSSDNSLRRRHRHTTPHRRRATPHRRRPTPNLNRSPWPIEVFHKSRSEPSLKIEDSGSDDYRSSVSDAGGWLFHHQTCNDVFSSQTLGSDSSRSLINEGHQKDAKVVVTVTVEGSTGPIRTMVRLASNVDDMIKLVIDKYGEEGRRPRLDRSSASCFDLHLSHFSLECLDRSNAIGDFRSRCFYLRKRGGISAGNQLEGGASSSPWASSTVSIKDTSPEPPSMPLSAVFLPAFITQRITKLVRKICRIWKIYGCFHCR
ncbi:hypothetical protein Dimus_008864 [Dionaea muscipula]